MRHADANETVHAWKVALDNVDGPTILSLSRQNIPIFDKSRMGSAIGVEKGAYILVDNGGIPDAIIMASGSEVSIAVEASQILSENGI